MVKIRPYCKTDRRALLTIFRRNVPEYFGQEEQLDLELYLEEFGPTHFVAELNGQLIGSGGYVVKRKETKHAPAKDPGAKHALGKDPGTEGWLSWYFVDPSVKGEGVGSLLVNHVLEVLYRAGAGEVLVNTSQRAAGFFARFGFEETHREKDYWADGLDLVAMRYEAD